MADDTAGNETSKATPTATERAGLAFSVGRIHKQLKQRATGHGGVNSSAAVYAAAALEYLTAEVLDLAAGVAKDFSQQRITPRHLQVSIRGDAELDALLRGTIAGGGVTPHIHKELFPGKRNAARASAKRRRPGGATKMSEPGEPDKRSKSGAAAPETEPEVAAEGTGSGTLAQEAEPEEPSK